MQTVDAEQARPRWSPGTRPLPDGATFPPLDDVTKPLLSTEEAAFYTNRQPQTLRAWACLEAGPIRPVRILRGGPLGWRTDDVRQLVGVSHG